MKKHILFLLAITFLFTSCKPQYVDRPAEDGKFHYRNDDFGFSLILPKEFIYYQTQRRDLEKFTDIEFLVPTSDTGYEHIVSIYARPLYVRIYDIAEWEEDIKAKEDGDKFYVLDAKKDKIYLIRFWDEIPADWQDKWNEDMQKEIINSFKLK